MDARRAINPSILLVVALAISVTAIYGPVTTGSFLFDDYVNLKSLGQYGRIDDLDGALRYLTSGIADPLGRPVAMASFLLDSRSWPATPGPFLRTNVLIHTVNSLLLTWLLLRVGKQRGLTNPLTCAIAGAALWALHPLWVSTVGYVVQRHAMLAATFVLLGLIAWTQAIQCFRDGDTARGWKWAIVVLPTLGVFAALSKANGILLPLLALVLQHFLLNTTATPSISERRATRTILLFPTILLASALLISFEPLPADRPWTTVERVMSQPRAIADYLWHLFLPRVNSTGLFADGFVHSSSLIQPLTTFPSLVFISAAALAPFFLRQSFPMLSGAVAFYFGGHLIESTIIPLELYFEHRNYLPSLLLGWPIAVGLLAPSSLSTLRRISLGSLLIALAVVTHQRAVLWADTPRQALIWAEQLPTSPRAQTWAAQHEIEAGQPLAARNRLRAALLTHPSNAMLALNLLDVECTLNQVDGSTLEAAERAVAQAGLGEDMVNNWLRTHILSPQQTCESLGPRQLEQLVRVAEARSTDQPLTLSRQRRLEAMVALAFRQCDQAISRFDAAQSAVRRLSSAYGDAALLASMCSAEHALIYLDGNSSDSGSEFHEPKGMLRLHQWLLSRQGYWEAELEQLRSTLESETKKSAG